MRARIPPSPTPRAQGQDRNSPAARPRAHGSRGGPSDDRLDGLPKKLAPRIAARRPRFESREPDPAQPSLFPGLPAPPRIQAAIRLTEANVAHTVPPRSPGVYFPKIVGPQGSVAERVRRDDVDLRQRLLQHAREGSANVLFGWMLAENPHEAYRLECYLWHAQGGAWARIEGDAHPAPAERIPFLGCPDCDE